MTDGTPEVDPDKVDTSFEPTPDGDSNDGNAQNGGTR